MKCWKCGKEMDRDDGGSTIKGIEVTVKAEPPRTVKKDINYYNAQLGKYSNGKGECEVGICYECYIDGLFNCEPWIRPRNMHKGHKTKGGNRQ